MEVYRNKREKISEAILQTLDKVIGSHFAKEKRLLVQSIDLPDLQKQLEEARLTQDPEQIAKKELEVCSQIQQAIRQYSFEDRSYNIEKDSPTEIVKSGYLNCVGYVELAHAMLSRIGIKHLVAGNSVHAIILIATENGKLFWFEAQNKKYNGELTNQDLEPINGKQPTVQEIVNFARSPNAEQGRMLKVKPDYLQERMPFAPQTSTNTYLQIEPPAYGTCALLLNQMGVRKTSKPDQVKTKKLIYEIATANFESLESNAWFNLAIQDYKEGNYSRALESLKKLLRIRPNKEGYNFLGLVYTVLGMQEQAKIAYANAERF